MPEAKPLKYDPTLTGQALAHQFVLAWLVHRIGQITPYEESTIPQHSSRGFVLPWSPVVGYRFSLFVGIIVGGGRYVNGLVHILPLPVITRAEKVRVILGTPGTIAYSSQLEAI